MKILVTGGAGFIGSHVVDAYLKLGHQVIVIDNLTSGKKANLNRHAKFYLADINQPKTPEIIKKEKPDIINHHAAQIEVSTSVKNPLYDAQVNILGSLNIFEAARHARVGKIIFASTGGAIYGDTKQLPTPETISPQPISPYGVAKLSVEYYLHYYFRQYHLPYLALRYANVYGPRQNPYGEAGVIAIFANKMLKKEQPIINGDGTNTRDYLYISDVVQANLLALTSKSVGIFNLGTAQQTTTNTIFAQLSRLIQAKVRVVHGPVRAGEQRTSALNFAKAKKSLHWQPQVNLDEGLKKTIAWFKKQHQN